MILLTTQECEESAPTGLWEAVGIRKLTWRDGCRVLLLSLWDPDQRRYVPFPEWAWLERLLAPQQAQTCEKPTPFKAGPSAVQGVWAALYRHMCCSC